MPPRALATDRNIPMIHRVQPGSGSDLLSKRPHLSLYPEFHAGVGLDCHLQASSPIRRYMDLVLQRQLIATICARGTAAAYLPDELLNVLAAAENAESDGQRTRTTREALLDFKVPGATTPSGRQLEAVVFRDGASAELTPMRCAARYMEPQTWPARHASWCNIARIEPVRGWLTMDYLGPSPSVHPKETIEFARPLDARLATLSANDLLQSVRNCPVPNATDQSIQH